LIGHEKNILTEIFVHGSYCISFSGICYISSVFGGRSGNRGRCSQPCRDRYLTTPEGKNFPLNLKDNSAFFDLREISDAGVDAIKIEGRIKKFDYVYTVVDCWKKQIQNLYYENRLTDDNRDLYKVFNREFSNSYLMGDINKHMFIDNPRDHSIKHLAENKDDATNERRESDPRRVHKEKRTIIANVKNRIKQLSIAKAPLTISISGKLDSPLKVSVETPDTSFVVCSKQNLSPRNRKSSVEHLNYDIFLKRLRALNHTGYYIKHTELDHLQKDLYITFKELTSIKKSILTFLDGPGEIVDPIDVPFLKKPSPGKTKPALSVLISSKKDLNLSNKTSVKLFFQLPNCFGNENSEFIDLFLKHKHLMPWFPSILIGKNYSAAVDILQQVKPELIVTDNTGIAYEADRKGIPWIAGPYLNLVNSFSLLCLKEKFNCYGAFISNEIGKKQINSIIAPDKFKLFYRIFHPELLLSSRQCLFHQVIGCQKKRIDENCLKECKQISSIKNMKNISLHIEKTEGNYHCIYHQHHFLNTDIVTDLPELFSSFLIDLRDIKTETKIERDKAGIIRLFENLLNGDPDSKVKLNQLIHPSTDAQYKRGI